MIAELLALSIQGRLTHYDLRHAALSLWLNASGAPREIAARAGSCVRVLHHVYTHCIDGREDLISQQIEDALDPDSSTHHIGLLAGTFRTFIHMLLRGAGGARTHDRRIMSPLL
jgi:hypothetical protein